MKATNVVVSDVDSSSGYDGLAVKVKLERLRNGRFYVGDRPNVDDVPDDVILGLHAWLLSTDKGRELAGRAAITDEQRRVTAARLQAEAREAARSRPSDPIFPSS